VTTCARSGPCRVNSTGLEEDVRLTRRLAKVSEIVGVPLMDHVVIGRDAYTSLKEEGMIGG
jgi:DNA repair protein RadC